MTGIRKDLALVPPSPEGEGGPGPEHPLVRRIDVLRHAAHRVRQGGDDKAVHDARVATRRLAAILDVWKEEMAPKPRRRARRALRRLRRRLGAAREREVSLEQIDHALGEAVGEDAAALAALATRLRERLPQDRAKVEGAARPGLVEKIVAVVERSVAEGSSAPWAGPHAVEEISARVARRRDEALLALDEALEHPRDEALHAARIRAKKWRYGEEALAEAKRAGEPKVLSELRALQEALGANQDRAVLAVLLERAARREAKRENAGRARALRSRAAALRQESAQRRADLVSLRDRLRAEPPVPSPPSG
jgi:CHAD domain-containing protein